MQTYSIRGACHFEIQREHKWAGRDPGLAHRCYKILVHEKRRVFRRYAFARVELSDAVTAVIKRYKLFVLFLLLIFFLLLPMVPYVLHAREERRRGELSLLADIVGG